MTVEEAIKIRRTIRNFTDEKQSKENIEKIILSGIYAPFGGSTGMALKELRKIFVFAPETENKNKARNIIQTSLKAGATQMNKMLEAHPEKKATMGSFAKRMSFLAEKGIPSLSQNTYYIVMAEKKGTPPVEKQSMAYALENMWLTATDLGLGFHLLSATSAMEQNQQFLDLIGLPMGEYALDGCIIGTPNRESTLVKTFDIDDFVRWM